MKKRAARKTTTSEPIALRERGINLDVRGAALVSQLTQRVTWHKRASEAKTAELKIIAESEGRDLGAVENWKRDMRRSDLGKQIHGHDEHARFLDFLRAHIRPRRVYRVTLHDLSELEIMPRGSYL